MPNSFFKFKQFTIYHDRCAMKVGTDGVLVGAWADVSAARKVLDIGTGSGLIALMMAQRCGAFVKGIDIDGEAVGQAAENAAFSPWGDRVEMVQADVKEFASRSAERFDVIVSNPPYFEEKTFCPDGLRNAARHTGGLGFDDLLQAVAGLLTEDGVFSVILPADASCDFIGLAVRHGMFLKRQTWVHTKPDAKPKRVLMAFSKLNTEVCTPGHLVIESENRRHSDEYIALTKDFYLSM